MNISGLIEDIGVSFGLPSLFLLLALANIKFSSRRNSELKLRLSLAFAIALFAYLICTLMFQDRTVLESLWNRSPILYSLAYSLGVLMVLTGIGALIHWKLRPKLWRGNERRAIDD